MRELIEQLDSHVSSKLSLASLLSVISFVVGLGEREGRGWVEVGRIQPLHTVLWYWFLIT